MSTGERARLAQAIAVEVRKFIAASILFNHRVAEGLGLNGTDLQCLHLLQLQGLATPGELARRSGLTTGGVTVALDRLERAGYVRREPNPDDRRSTIVRPVAARVRKLEATYRKKSELLLGVLSSYDESRLRVILEFFSSTNGADRAAAGESGHGRR